MNTDSNPEQLSVAFSNGAQLSVAIANGAMNLNDAIRQHFDRVREYNHYSMVGFRNQVREASNVDVEKCCDDSDEGGFYDCNICLDLAKDPVVTLCGHLFCWPCLYRWLYLRSSGTKDCPVCKEQVTDKNVIPIYGGRNNDHVRNEDSSSATRKIPSRPNARHVSGDLEARQIRRFIRH
jgi:hypothetical protein